MVGKLHISMIIYISLQESSRFRLEENSKLTRHAVPKTSAIQPVGLDNHDPKQRENKCNNTHTHIIMTYHDIKEIIDVIIPAIIII